MYVALIALLVRFLGGVPAWVQATFFDLLWQSGQEGRLAWAAIARQPAKTRDRRASLLRGGL